MEGKSAVAWAVPAVVGRAVSAPPVTPDLSSVTAVLAHTMLNSLAIVRGGNELLHRHGRRLRRVERRAWALRIDHHTEFLADVLERMAQGRFAEALALCDQGAPSGY